MEPGHEDREYAAIIDRLDKLDTPQWSPVMKTGNTAPPEYACPWAGCLNGARS